MKPTIVIATHQRVSITHKLIDSLWPQHPELNIVLVVSLIGEFNYFKQFNHDRLHVVMWSNRPLGGKWQQGINVAKSIKADPVIILGSDDTINPEFVTNAINLLNQGYHFIGLRRYQVLHDKTLYQFDYKPIMPLGGGRVYSAELLNAIKWQLFEQKDKHLDDFGWKQVIKSKKHALLVTDIDRNGLYITAIKGQWVMLNPFNPKHRNLKLVKKTPCAE